MHMITKLLRYSIGTFKNLFNPAISILAKVDPTSIINKKAKIYGFTKIYHSSIGAYSYVGRNSSLVYANIGKFCSIAGNVSIGMATHTLSKLSTSPIFTERNNGTGHTWANKHDINPYNTIEIGNDVWIGERVMIVGGVKIGNGAVIGAGAIVTKDIPPYAVAVGIPAKVIRYRFRDEIITYLEDLQWWNLDEVILKQHIKVFQSDKLSIFTLSSLKKD